MIEISLEGALALDKKLAAMTPRQGNLKRRMIRIVARKAKEYSKKHIKQQSDLGGSAWEKRKSGRRKKMLLKLGRKLKIVSSTDTQAVIGWASGLTAIIAGKHQFGHSETFTKANFKKKDKLDTKSPATRQQAKALLQAGYKVKKSNGRGHRKPTIKWIVANLNISKAGIIIRALRGTKNAWKITLPARSFLGLTESEMSEIIDSASEELKTAMKLN